MRALTPKVCAARAPRVVGASRVDRVRWSCPPPVRRAHGPAPRAPNPRRVSPPESRPEPGRVPPHAQACVCASH